MFVPLNVFLFNKGFRFKNISDVALTFIAKELKLFKLYGKFFHFMKFLKMLRAEKDNN